MSDKELASPGIGDNSDALRSVDRLTDIARELVNVFQDIVNHCDEATSNAEEFGALCLEAEPLVPKGQWHRWLKKNACGPCGVTLRTVQKWMQWAREVKVDEISKDGYGQPGLDHARELLDFMFQDDPYEDVPETPLVGSVSVPPQTKRTETKVQVKTPVTVKGLPRGVP
jgi:hypothetical protein